MRAAQNIRANTRHLIGPDHTAANGVLQIVVQVSHNVCYADDSTFISIGYLIRIIRQYLSIALGMF